MTETDLDVGNLALKHDLSPAVITDLLQVLQKVTARNKSRSIDEPFALNFKALRIRTDVVQGLAGKVGGAKSKPNALSVRGKREAVFTLPCGSTHPPVDRCGVAAVVALVGALHRMQTEALLRREKQLRMELATSQRNAQQQGLNLAQYQQQVRTPHAALAAHR